MKIKVLLFILAALLITGVATQAGNIALRVTVHIDHSGSSELLNGDYVNGERLTRTSLRVEQAVSGSSITTAEMYNNLCIAQIKQDKLQAARTICKRAVSNAMRMSAGIGQNPKALKHVKAVALSNRGVVNMLHGKIDRALADFAKAKKLSPSFESAELNLAAAMASNSDSGLAVVIN